MAQLISDMWWNCLDLFNVYISFYLCPISLYQPLSCCRQQMDLFSLILWVVYRYCSVKIFYSVAPSLEFDQFDKVQDIISDGCWNLFHAVSICNCMLQSNRSIDNCMQSVWLSCCKWVLFEWKIPSAWMELETWVDGIRDLSGWN